MGPLGRTCTFLDPLTYLATPTTGPPYTSSVCPSQGWGLISSPRGGSQMEPRNHRGKDSRLVSWFFFKGNLSPKPGLPGISTLRKSPGYYSCDWIIYSSRLHFFFFHRKIRTQREGEGRKVVPSPSRRLLTASQVAGGGGGRGRTEGAQAAPPLDPSPTSLPLPAPPTRTSPTTHPPRQVFPDTSSHILSHTQPQTAVGSVQFPSPSPFFCLDVISSAPDTHPTPCPPPSPTSHTHPSLGCAFLLYQ